MQTKLMGILNITPDSFSDGGDYFNNTDKAIARVKEMIAEGADYIDIGGESTRFFSFFDYKGSSLTDTKEELKRVLPVIKAIKKNIPDIKLSIDTYKATVADEALRAGAKTVNSLGGFLFDEKLAAVVAKHNCMIIIYHIKDKQKISQNICEEIYDFFVRQINIGKKYGIPKEKFILDPGIGFGKSVEQNLEILKNLSAFKKLNLPILIGVSRKSHLGMIFKEDLNLETQPLERLEGSLAETAIAVQNGASIIRTHDILQTKKFLTVLGKFL